MIGSIAAVSAPARAQALPPSRVGVLIAAGPHTHGAMLKSFTTRLEELGLKDGKEIVLDVLWGNGEFTNFRSIVGEMLARKPSVTLTSNTSMTLAARSIDPSVPLVFTTVADAVGSGLALSLSRPSLNATGIQINSESLPSKQLSILKGMIPIERIGVLVNPSNISTLMQLGNFTQAAVQFNATILPRNAADKDEIVSAIRWFTQNRADALIVPTDATYITLGEPLAVAALELGLPTFMAYREQVGVGGLCSYSADLVECFRQGADYVSRIVHGERANDLPISFARKFNLVLNARTAQLLGIRIPQELLALADEVIE